MLKKTGIHIVYICSIVFFLGTSFVLYHEYINYNKRVKRYTKEVPVNIENANNVNFTNTDITILENYREQRNVLLAYEAFLKESAINYNPNDYSYANILKENFTIQLDNIKFSQSYWNTILTSFYTNISSGKNIPLDGYDAMMRIPTTFLYSDVEGIEDIQIIEKISTEEYWKRQVIELDRTSQNIKNTWKQNKAFFYTFMSKSKYDKLCKKVVDDLIEVKKKINQQPNYKEFYEMYSISDSIFLTFPDTEFVKSYEYSWTFSFWDRRYEEKNDAIVYNILNEIKNHYEN